MSITKMISDASGHDKPGPNPSIAQKTVSQAYWDVMDSPLGDLFIAQNVDGALFYLSYGRSPEESFEGRATNRAKNRGSAVPAIKPAIKWVRDPQRLESVCEQLREYFAGKRRQFDVAIDLSRLTPFQRRVLTAACDIPYGSVATYKGLATRIDKPGAARAVGTALGQNPIALIVPCHRIIASDGSLGGYSAPGGIQTKRLLLDLESERRLELP